MQIHLVLPGLVWPSAQAANPAAGLTLPALSSLLGRATARLASACPYESWLGNAFGLTGDALPLAALRRLGEDACPPPAPAAEWLCADPAHLHFAREHLLLADASGLAIAADEADALVAALNEIFTDVGEFELGAPDRWYLRLAEPSRGRFFPLNDVVGRPIAHFLPEGEAGRSWQRTMNEAQVVMHNHPVNEARAAAGLPAVNSVWLWGSGPLPASAQPPLGAIQADSPLPRGLARSGGIEPTAPDATTAAAHDTLVVLEDLLRPALYLDLDAWREALVALEARWFAPFDEALQRGRISRLRISAPGDRATLDLSMSAGQRWKFWRRPRSLDTLLHSILPPAQAPAPAHQP